MMRWLRFVLDVCIGLLMVDWFRMRRDLHIDARAKRAVELLTNVTMVDGVELPDPADTRWMLTTRAFGAFGKTAERFEADVLVLGEIIVRLDTFTVFVGNGPPLADGEEDERYAKAVIAAHRRRLVAQVK